MKEHSFVHYRTPSQILYLFLFIHIVPLYKKRRDTFKRTKTTGVIPLQGASARKTGRANLTSAGQRQETTASLTSAHLGQNTYQQNEGIQKQK